MDPFIASERSPICSSARNGDHCCFTETNPASLGNEDTTQHSLVCTNKAMSKRCAFLDQYVNNLKSIRVDIWSTFRHHKFIQFKEVPNLIILGISRSLRTNIDDMQRSPPSAYLHCLILPHYPLPVNSSAYPKQLKYESVGERNKIYHSAHSTGIVHDEC